MRLLAVTATRTLVVVVVAPVAVAAAVEPRFCPARDTTGVKTDDSVPEDSALPSAGS